MTLTPTPIKTGTQALVESLCEREFEVLCMVAGGLWNGQIVAVLVIITGTVKKHLNNIFGKLSVQSRARCGARARQVFQL